MSVVGTRTPRVVASTAPAPAIRVRPRSALALLLVSLIGLAAFTWPLFADGDFAVEHSTDAPLLFGVLMLLLVGVLLAEIAEGGIDAKAVALLGVLTAVGTALRPLGGGGVTGFSPMFLLIVLGGRVLGRGFGFVLGALTMFTSALATGGVGPWLPFQMIGAAWVGFGAGCLPRAEGRAEIALIATYGAVSGLLYGFLLNLWFWPFIGTTSELSFEPGAPLSENLGRFLAFCLATSLGFDIPRAIGNVVLVVAVGAPLLRTLRRASRRAAFEADVRFEQPPVAAEPAATTQDGPR